MDKNCTGKIFFVRYADDFVCLFKKKKDAENFYRWLPGRMGKFKLELAPDKTQLLTFWGEPYKERFTFLGFEFYRGRTRRGGIIAYARTSPKKLNVALGLFKDWLRENISLGTAAIFEKVRLKLVGHCNYFGLAGNCEMLKRYFYYVKEILWKYLNRRSQRRSCNWEKFYRLLRIYGIPRPRITWDLKEQPTLWAFL